MRNVHQNGTELTPESGDDLSFLTGFLGTISFHTLSKLVLQSIPLKKEKFWKISQSKEKLHSESSINSVFQWPTEQPNHRNQ